MEKIIDKIKKLLALATNNSSVEEAASAMAAAQRLMSEYQIEHAMLEDTDESGPKEAVAHDVLYDDGGKRLPWWRWIVANALCKANECKAYVVRPGVLGYIGRASDAQTVRYMFTYITAEIDRLCQDASKAADVSARGKGFAKTWNNSFRVGAALEVGNRLVATQKEVFKEAEEAGKGDALAIIQEHALSLDVYAKKVLHLHSGGTVQANVNRDARDAGRAAGRSIQLGKGTARLGGPSPMLKGKE